MIPDVSKESKQSWLILGGAAMLALLVVFFITDWGQLAEDAEARRSQLETKGREDMRKHVGLQEEANKKLRQTIENLKQETGFELQEYYKIPSNVTQPGYYFTKKFVEVRERLRDRASARRIVYDENIGFGANPKVPDNSEAPYLMAMLQITEKVVGIAIDTPAPLETFSVEQLKAVDTGPVTRPALVREYPLTLKVRGGLKDILWILHRISEVKDAEKGSQADYPLILRGFSIKSENSTPKDDINQLDAVFELAAMRFITEEERAKDPLAFQPNNRASGKFSSGSGRGVFYARP